MIWEVGKEYRLKNGYAAVINEIMPDGKMFGRWQFPEDGKWVSNAWRASDGRDIEGDEPDFDLLPPRPPVVVSDEVRQAFWSGVPERTSDPTPGIRAAIEAYLAEREDQS